jgi:hypothetical protein
LRTKIRKLLKGSKLVTDKKKIPRNQINESDGNSSVAYLVVQQQQQQQQRSLQSDELAPSRAPFSLDSRVPPETLISFSSYTTLIPMLWLKL